RTTDNRIDGVVLTFTAVTQLRQARDYLEKEVEKRTTELTAANQQLRQELAERQQSEKSLRDSQARLSAILTSPDSAIITIHQRGRIESVNGAAERMFGWKAAEMVGHNVTMLMPPPYEQEHDRYLADYLRTGVKKILGIGREVVARRKDGSTFPIDLSVSEM